jgi:hypothetical protein
MYYGEPIDKNSKPQISSNGTDTNLNPYADSTSRRKTENFAR